MVPTACRSLSDTESHERCHFDRSADAQGGAPWQTGVYDEKTNTFVIGTGNPAPWNHHCRSGPNGDWKPYDSPYTSSQIYIDPSHGEPVGLFQHRCGAGSTRSAMAQEISSSMQVMSGAVTAIGTAMGRIAGTTQELDAVTR